MYMHIYMLGSTQVSGGEVLWKSGKKKKKYWEKLRFHASANRTQVCWMEWVSQSFLLPPVQIYSRQQGVRELKLQKKNQAESEPADKFCVLGEGLELLKCPLQMQMLQ